MKCQELRPPDIGSTKISDVMSGETGFAYKRPDPAPPRVMDSSSSRPLLILQWGIAHHTQEPLISLPAHKLKFLPLEISHPETQC